MKNRKLMLAIMATSALALSTTVQANIVSAPWAPDTGNGSEPNLYTILGFANNADLNAAIVNQSGGVATVFSMPLGDLSASFVVEYAGNAANNNFGVYGVSALGSAPTSSLLQLIAGASPPSGAVTVNYNAVAHTVSVAGGGTINVAGDSSIGFYLTTGTLNPDYNAFYSSYINSGDFEHAVLFDGTPSYPGSYILGWEDETAAENTDLDYQDMVVSITPVAVPEATTAIAGALLLLPFGASTLRILRRNRTA